MLADLWGTSDPTTLMINYCWPQKTHQPSRFPLTIIIAASVPPPYSQTLLLRRFQGLFRAPPLDFVIDHRRITEKANPSLNFNEQAS